MHRRHHRPKTPYTIDMSMLARTAPQICDAPTVRGLENIVSYSWRIILRTFHKGNSLRGPFQLHCETTKELRKRDKLWRLQTSLIGSISLISLPCQNYWRSLSVYKSGANCKEKPSRFLIHCLSPEIRRLVWLWYEISASLHHIWVHCSGNPSC